MLTTPPVKIQPTPAVGGLAIGSHQSWCDLRFERTRLFGFGGRRWSGRRPEDANQQMSKHDLPDETVERIDANRDDLHQIADSDLPVDWVADALLRIVDDTGGDE